MALVRMGLRVLMEFLPAAYLLLVLFAAFAERLIFRPHAATYHLESLPHSGSGEIQGFRIPSQGESLAAIYLPNRKAQSTLLYSHGNGEDLGDDLPLLEAYRRAGFAVFAYDYQGYGQSSGKPSEPAVYHDAEAAYDFLTGRLQVPKEQIIVFGHSLGAAVSIHLAAHRPAAGLILLAPFLSAFRVVTQWQIVPWDKFNNAQQIRYVHCPVLIAHGRKDEVIPFWQGERIFRLANEPKQRLWLNAARHNDVMIVAQREFLQSIQEFARQRVPA